MIETLDFRYDLDGDFTIATDQYGWRYRVLLAAGGPAWDTFRFYLEPWVPSGIAAHRGVRIKASHRLHDAIRDAESRRPRRVATISGTRFEADFI